MRFIEDKFNELVLAFLRQISLRFGVRIGLRRTDSDSNKLILEANASILSRGVGLYIILFSLIPFRSDFLEEPGNIFGYDFYNHWEAVPLRLCTILPGLWILLIHGKVTRCIFDKNNNTFLVEQKSYLANQRSEGHLQEISALEISQVERSAESFFERDDIFTKIQVNLLKHSGEPVSFTFVEHKSRRDSAILQVRNMLCEFLDLPS